MLLYLLLASLRGALPVVAAPRKAAGEETPGQLRSKADEALLKKDTDTALSLLARAIKLEPDNERNYFKRANVLKRAGKASRAVEDLDSALRIKPGYGAALLMRARALLGIGRCAEAKRDYDAAKDKDGSGAAAGCVAALQAADKARAKGDRRLELEHLAEVLEKYASDQPSHLLLLRARAHYDRKDWYECIAESGKALKQTPDDLEALELRGSAYYFLADHAMAKTHWQQALRSDPEHPGCKSGYKKLRSLTKKDAAGDKHAATGDHEKAVEQWVSALSVDASHAVFHASTNLKIAASYLELKDYSNAKRHCDAVLSHDDKNVDALIRRTEAEIGAEDYESARRTAARAREVSDDDRTRKNQQKAEVALKQSKEVNHYKVLGVPRDARTRDIKKAYRDAALKYHPDKIAPDVSDSERERLTAKFQEIAAAYEILSDEETRAKYDAGEDVSGSGQQSQGFPGGFPGFPGGFPGGGFQQGGQRFTFTFR